jgi:hypothetical protein
MHTESSSPSSVPVGLPVAQRLAAAVKHYGETDVVDRAVALLGGANVGEEFLLYVGGEHAQGLLDGAPALYWPELWGARALLHVWRPNAQSAVQHGLGNQAWRVREMCARVTLERALELADDIRNLLIDEVPRVRIAALRALAEIGAATDTEAMVARLQDPDREVRRAAQQSRDALAERLAAAH